MASTTLRRRIYHGDVDGRKNEHMDTSGSDSLSEPLLGNYCYDGSQSEEYSHRSQHDTWDDKKKESLHWTFIFSQLIAQWTNWIGMVGGSLLRRAKKVVRRGGRSERVESSSSIEHPQEEQTQAEQTQEEAVPQRTQHRHSCDEGILLIDPDGSVRRRRGRTTCNDIQNLPPGQRVNIEINEQGIPYNQPEATLLSSYLGVIVRDATLAPISFTDWRNS